MPLSQWRRRGVRTTNRVPESPEVPVAAGTIEVAITTAVTYPYGTRTPAPVARYRHTTTQPPRSRSSTSRSAARSCRAQPYRDRRARHGSPGNGAAPSRELDREMDP